MARKVGYTIFETVVQYEVNKGLDHFRDDDKKTINSYVIGKKAYVKTRQDGFLSLKELPHLNSYRIIKMPESSIVKIIDIAEIPQNIEGKRGIWCKVEYGN